MVKRLLFSMLAVAAIGAGCAVKTDDQTADQLQRGTRDAAEKLSAVAGEAGEAASKTFSQTSLSAIIKTVLNKRRDIDSAGVNIDTIERTVHVKGSVPDEDMRKKVMEVAKVVAGPDYKVSDELKLGSGAETRADDSR